MLHKLVAEPHIGGQYLLKEDVEKVVVVGQRRRDGLGRLRLHEEAGAGGIRRYWSEVPQHSSDSDKP